MTTSHIRAEAVTEAILSMFRTGAAGLRFTPTQGQQLANAILSRATLQEPESESQATSSDIERLRTATVNGEKLVLTENDRDAQHLNNLGIPAVTAPKNISSRSEEAFLAYKKYKVSVTVQDRHSVIASPANPGVEIKDISSLPAPSEDIDHIFDSPAPPQPQLYDGLTFPQHSKEIHWFNQSTERVISALRGSRNEYTWEDRVNAFQNLRHLARHYGRTDKELMTSILTFSRARDKDMQCLHSRDLITAVITSLKAAHAAELPTTSDTIRA